MKTLNWKLIAFASLVTLSGQQAMAASNTCWMVTSPYRCSTTAVAADSRNHYVHITISPKVKYQVIDAANGVVVDSGTSGWTGKQKTITGLYSRYYIKAEAGNPLRAFATIDNN